LRWLRSWLNMLMFLVGLYCIYIPNIWTQVNHIVISLNWSIYTN
jgi:hypothetical protein